MPDLLTLVRRKTCGFAVIPGLGGASCREAKSRGGEKASLLLHIGTHKTGSTAIQRALRNNRRKLSRSGFLVQPPTINDLRAMLALKHLDEGLRAKIAGQFEALRTKRMSAMVVSDEGFSGDPLSGYRNAPEIARRLGRCTAGVEVKVVVYLRRQDEFIESLYMQKIHEGHSMPFAEFLEQLSGVHFDWYALLESYAEVFGRRNIIVRRYEKRFMPRRESLLEEFFGIVGVDCSKLNLDQGEAAPNAGYGALALAVARQCNPHLSPVERRELRHILQASVSKKPHEHYAHMNGLARSAILARHEASNARVAREYLADPSGRLFEAATEDDGCSAVIAPTQGEMLVTLVRILLQTRSCQPSSKLGRAFIRLGRMLK